MEILCRDLSLTNNTRNFMVHLYRIIQYLMARETFFKMNFLLLTVSSVLFVSCSSGEGQEKVPLKKQGVPENSVGLQAESANKVAMPAWIQVTAESVLFADAGTHRITGFERNGKPLLSFGAKGRGPGEYLSVGGFWSFKDLYLVFDNTAKKLITYDHEGNHAEDFLLDFVDFPPVPVSIEAISPTKFVMPTGGQHGTLLALVNTKTKHISYWGDAISEFTGFIQSSGAQRKAISAVTIPDMYKNNVLLASNRTGIFSFQQTTAILEKYSTSGDLLWEKNVQVPAIVGLFEKLFEENSSRIKSDTMLLPFAYANAIAANEHGVAIKLNLLQEQPVTIVWVPNDGKELTVVTFEDLEKSPPVPLRLAISDSDIFFSNTLEGKIYRADWPL